MNFCRILESLVSENFVGVITGDFNYNLSNVSTNKLLHHMIGYSKFQMNQQIYLDPK